MGKYAVETRNSEPKNFFAGEFPTLTEAETAGEDLAEHTPVMLNGEGELVAVTAVSESESEESAAKAATDKVVGITAEAAKKGDPVVYYLTGEFFADAITLPDGVEIGTLKDSLRRLSIFLR